MTHPQRVRRLKKKARPAPRGACRRPPTLLARAGAKLKGGVPELTVVCDCGQKSIVRLEVHEVLIIGEGGMPPGWRISDDGKWLLFGSSSGPLICPREGCGRPVGLRSRF